MKVAVIGAGGFIGKALVLKLKKLGIQVASFSSQVDDIFTSPSGVINFVSNLINGSNCIVYLAQSPFYRQVPEKADHLWAVNVISAMKIAEMARQVGASKYIYASTGNVYSPSFSPSNENSPVRRDDWYSLSKIHAEESLAIYRKDMDIISTRIFGVYGPGQLDKLIPNLAKSIRAGVPIKLASMPSECANDGLKISLCYIDNVVNIFTQLMESKAPDVINIAGPEVLSIRHIAQQIGEQIGVEPLFELALKPRAFDLIADVSKLVEIFNPIFVPFAEGIERTLHD